MPTPSSISSVPIGTNPVDLVEEIVLANDWSFERTSDDEIIMEITGRWCDYRLFFLWQREMGALYFSCLLDMRVDRSKIALIRELTGIINERLWVGHFDLSSEDGMPMYRHTSLLRGMAGGCVELIEEQIDVALNECERFYPAFQFVLWGGKTPDEAIAAAMIDPVGEA